MASEQCAIVLHVSSIIVYSVNAFADWILTYCVGKELAITFKPFDWLPLLMIACSTFGSVCTFCMYYLCFELTFGRRRLESELYRSGCALLWQRLLDWFWRYDCFRLSF